MFPDGMSQTESGYDFPWLTQTPTTFPSTPVIVSAEGTLSAPSADETPTLVPPIMNTPLAISSLSPNEPPSDSKPLSSLPCGSAALAPLVMVTWLIKKRRYTE